jgi:putative transposase
MARRPRIAPGGEVYHVINRAAGRFRMLRTPADFEAFERILCAAQVKVPTRILGYCLLGNHWHFVVWPRKDGELTNFFRWMTHTHAMRWRVSHRSVGSGPLYQGRFKSFPIQRDEHLEMVLRYVERNAMSAGLCEQAEDWRHGSLWVRGHGSVEMRSILSDWPIEMPDDWSKWVNRPLTDRELERIHRSRDRGQPLGSEAWTRRAVSRLGLEHTIRREGRPKKDAGT